MVFELNQSGPKSIKLFIIFLIKFVCLAMQMKYISFILFKNSHSLSAPFICVCEKCVFEYVNACSLVHFKYIWEFSFVKITLCEMLQTLIYEKQ